MSKPITERSVVDLPALAADLLADSGLFDRLVAQCGRALAALPETLVQWLGPELKTPDNMAAPSVGFGEHGPWNGVVFVESDEPSYWVFVRASAGRQRGTTRLPQADRDHWSSRPQGSDVRPSDRSWSSAMYQQDPLDAWHNGSR